MDKKTLLTTNGFNNTVICTRFNPVISKIYYNYKQLCLYRLLIQCKCPAFGVFPLYLWIRGNKCGIISTILRKSKP